MISYLEDGKTGKRPCFSVDVYMKQLYELRALYGVRRVYVATDSQGMLDRMQRETSFNWVFYNLSRSFLGIEHGLMDFRDSKVSSSILFSFMADLQLMRNGDIFLGGFASHFSKLAYYIMAGTLMRLPLFISVDYPLSCDTSDRCGDEDIKRRFTTVEDMIQHAVECQRLGQEGVPWGPKGQEDPCGIYDLV
jgi:hypothetical protein